MPTNKSKRRPNTSNSFRIHLCDELMIEHRQKPASRQSESQRKHNVDAANATQLNILVPCTFVCVCLCVCLTKKSLSFFHLAPMGWICVPRPKRKKNHTKTETTDDYVVVYAL